MKIKSIKSILIVIISLFALNLFSIDQIPDCKTIFFNTYAPKAGQNNVSIPSGTVRNMASTWYEGWWQEETYYRYNPTNGTTIHGFNMKTKTYGDIATPWCFGIQTNMNSPKGFVKLNRNSTSPTFGGELNREDRGQRYGGTGPLMDNVWTPGERFQDTQLVAGQPPNGKFDAIVFDEDYWASSNTNVFINLPQKYLVKIGTGCSPNKGEYYADYDNNTIVDATTSIVLQVGFDTAAEICVADTSSGTNKIIILSEQNLNPASNPSVWGNEGDMSHTIINAGLITGNVSIPKNGKFDHNVDINFNPLVYPAKGNGISSITGRVYVTFTSYLWKNVAAPYASGNIFRVSPLGADGYTGNPPYYTGSGNANIPPLSTDVGKYTIYVPVYQAGEIWGQYVGSQFNENLYIDWGYPDFADPNYPNDNKWTKGNDHEPFEDFLSWWIPDANGVGAWVSGVSGCPNLSTNHLGATPETANIIRDDSCVVDWNYYTNYIWQNYPGNAAALISRTGNGIYDGPDDWDESGAAVAENNAKLKMQQHGFIEGLTVAVPGSYGASGWDYYNTYDNWQGWWNATYNKYGCIGSPSWETRIPNVVSWAGNSTNAYISRIIGTNMSLLVYSSVWHPPLNSTWGYHSPREFDDLPSSIYHSGGDLRLGEVTDPWSWSIYGTDRGNNDSSIRNINSDGIIPSAGPMAYDVNGINGLDAGNQLSIELLTWRTDGTYFTGPKGGGIGRGLIQPPYTRDHRDVNLDGLIDQGETVPEKSCNYSTDAGVNPSGGRLTSYPFNWTRYFEDCIAAWDTPENFLDLIGNNSQAIIEPRIQSPSGFKWIDGIPMTGYLKNVLWHKNGNISHTSFDSSIDSMWIDNNHNGIYNNGDIIIINHGLTNGTIGMAINNIAWLDQYNENGNKDGIFTPIHAYTNGNVVATIGDVLWVDAISNGTYNMSSSYTIPIYLEGWVASTNAGGGEGSADGIGPHIAGFTFSCPTRDNVTVSGFAHVWPANTNFVGATHEQGHELVGWPDYYDYNVSDPDVVHYPDGIYDLMSIGNLVHGIGSTKMWWTSPNYLNWGDNPILWAPNTGMHTLLLYPVERVIDQYYWFINPKNPSEAFCFWYVSGQSPYSVFKGVNGIMIEHVDGGTPFGHPEQQRVNSRFSSNIIQADGLGQMEDGISTGDIGDLWGRTLGTRIFTAYGPSNARAIWWDGSESGIQIDDIRLPLNPLMPVEVDFEWLSVSSGSSPLPPYVNNLISSLSFHSISTLYTADSNMNGIPDFEEFLTGSTNHFIINSMVVDYLGSPQITWKSPSLITSGGIQYGLDVTYTIYRKNNLTDPTWTPIGMVSGISGEPQQMKYYLDNGRSFLVNCGYYKVMATVQLAK